VARQRPIAGQRSRRTAVLERPVPTEPMGDEKDRPARAATRLDPLLLVAGLVVAVLLVTAGLLTVRGAEVLARASNPSCAGILPDTHSQSACALSWAG